MSKIPQFILKKSDVNGFGFYHYLHVKGGSGNWKDKKEEYLDGGEFDFLLFYASPDEMQGLDKCEMIWCKEKDIPFGTGKTIDEAYENYFHKINQPHS